MHDYINNKLAKAEYSPFSGADLKLEAYAFHTHFSFPPYVTDLQMYHKHKDVYNINNIVNAIKFIYHCNLKAYSNGNLYL